MVSHLLNQRCSGTICYMKVITSFLLILIVGFFIGRITVTPAPIAEMTPSELDSQFSDLEIRAKKDLANAGSTEEKLKEIQKLREETFQLFLANVALKLDKNFWSSVDLSAQPKTPEPVIKPDASIVASPIVSETVVDVKPESTSIVTQNTQSTHNEDARFIANNNRNGILKDPSAYYASSKLITAGNSRLMQRIQGLYKGAAKMSEPRNKLWKISINSSLNSVDNIWSGNVGIEIADENNIVFSSSNGNGSNNYFYQNSNDPGSLIVQASPDIFLYLKWQEGRQIFWGSVYKKAGNDKVWKLIGKIPVLAKE